MQVAGEGSDRNHKEKKKSLTHLSKGGKKKMSQRESEKKVVGLRVPSQFSVKFAISDFKVVKFRL